MLGNFGMDVYQKDRPICFIEQLNGMGMQHSAGLGIAIETRDQGSIKYRLPKEWSLISEELKRCKSITALKKCSKRELIKEYDMFEYSEAGCLI